MSDNQAILKYPRTLHLEGSKLLPGEKDAKQTPFTSLKGKNLVIEEKLDGANAAISFSPSGELLLQSRGHYLSGGQGEAQFGKLKLWANTLSLELLERLEDRYILYGEWLAAKHTVFYDSLPHLFFEFDLFDRHAEEFLSLEKRKEILLGLPLQSVPVLREGTFSSLKEITDLVAPSLYKSKSWREALRKEAERSGIDYQLVLTQTDQSDLSEGLYIKHEEEGRVVARYKWVRHDFLRTILASDSHWAARPLLENQLAPGVDIFSLTSRA